MISLVKFLTRQVNCVKVKSWDRHTLTYFIWEGITVKIWSVIVTLIYSDVNCGKWEKVYVRCLQRIILQIKLYCDSKSFRNLKNVIICVLVNIFYCKKSFDGIYPLDMIKRYSMQLLFLLDISCCRTEYIHIHTLKKKVLSI